MFLSLVELKSMAGQTGNGSEQKGRSGCVIDHLPETRVPFEVPYSSDPNSENISDLRKRGGCAEVSLEKPESLSIGNRLEKVRCKSCTFVFAKSTKS